MNFETCKLLQCWNQNILGADVGADIDADVPASCVTRTSAIMI